MSRYGGRERDREYDRRRSVDVTYEERDRYERGHDFHFNEDFETYREERTSGALVPIHQERVIERELVNIPAPAQERFVEIERVERVREEPIIEIHEPTIEVEIEKKITEHEHEHHHRHIVIDHGTTYINAAPPPPPPPAPPVVAKARQEVREREVTRVTLEGVRERRYGRNYRGSGDLEFVERDIKIEETKSIPSRPRERSSSRHVEYRRYKNYDEGFGKLPRHSTGILPNTSPRSSTSGFQNIPDWTVIDSIPAASKKESEIDLSWKNSVRRNVQRGPRERKGELWTEITKDLVDKAALEEFGYSYEETDDFIYIFEYLQRDQINDLIELSKDIRRGKLSSLLSERGSAKLSNFILLTSFTEKVEKIEKIERSERGRAGWEYDRVSERRDYTPHGERDVFRERRDIYYT